MTTTQHRRWIWVLSIALIASTGSAGYWFVRWGYLRVQVALGEEQARMFEECRIEALRSSAPERIVDYIQGAIDYYPSGTKQRVGSHVDRMVELSRQAAIRDMIAHLRVTTGIDLGADPEKWIERYGRENIIQSGAATNTNQSPSR